MPGTIASQRAKHKRFPNVKLFLQHVDAFPRRRFRPIPPFIIFPSVMHLLRLHPCIVMSNK
jgi:hypothetical protein